MNCDSIVHFARAIGAARSDRLEAARAEIAEQERVWRAISANKGAAYWVSQAETQWLAARAWVLFAEKKTDEALALMRRAVELEASSDKEAVTPGEVLPAGDLLGDMLLEAGRPSEGLAVFEADLTASPNRLNTLHGAGLAAERAGDSVAARKHYEELVEVAADSDPGLPRIERAQAFLNRQDKSGG